MSMIIVAAGCKCPCWGTAITLLFLMNEKFDYGRRESNTGPEST